VRENLSYTIISILEKPIRTEINWWWLAWDSGTFVFALYCFASDTADILKKRFKQTIEDMVNSQNNALAERDAQIEVLTNQLVAKQNSILLDGEKPLFVEPNAIPKIES
jgi:hypothetical protein